jgi:hypothetical protein
MHVITAHDIDSAIDDARMTQCLREAVRGGFTATMRHSHSISIRDDGEGIMPTNSARREDRPFALAPMTESIS